MQLMRLLPFVSFLVLVTFADSAFHEVFAQPIKLVDTAASQATPSEPSQQSPAEQFVQGLGNQAITVMADKNLTPQDRTQKYRAILQNAFDMPTIGHFVLGRAWNTATPEQKQTFMKLFEQWVLKIYGDRLNFYAGESFAVKSARQENEHETVVSSNVLHSDGSKPTQIDWRIRQEGSQMKVLDVVVEGVSQSVTQRQEYSAILQSNNGNIDKLLDLMRKRLQEPDPQDADSSGP